MKNKFSYRFFVGLLFGVMAGFIIWYWQKSTSAEDGALALLDRLAAAENRLRKLGEERLRSTESRQDFDERYGIDQASVPEDGDDLQEVRGVGPVFADRLRQAGIISHRQLASTSQEQLARILGASSRRVEAILEEARQIAS
jgi:predicted flap endonuclease-1-like 5' DNA nuclease